jgi:hypothetical protein
MKTHFVGGGAVRASQLRRSDRSGPGSQAESGTPYLYVYRLFTLPTRKVEGKQQLRHYARLTRFREVQYRGSIG